MLPSLIGVFGTFVIGGTISSFLIRANQVGFRWSIPLWLLTILTFITPISFVLLVLSLPFVGWPIEVLIPVLASISLSFPLTLFFTVAHMAQAKPDPSLVLEQKSKIPLVSVVVAGVGLPMLALILISLSARINFATRISFAFDGKIVEIFRAAHNHHVPAFTLETGAENRTFENVDDVLWREAKVGQHVTKVGGSPHCLLDGKRFRFVPRDFPFWYEPE
jgi:hypothetical protein